MWHFPEITPEQWEELPFTEAEINQQFDLVKSQVFQGNHANFLGSLLCNMEFQWCLTIDTACTTGAEIYWNPIFFMELPPATRLFALVHELWHTAYLHIPRMHDRNPRIWNYACDTVINSLMKEDGFTWEGFSPWYDPQYSWNDSSEVIYERMIQDEKQPPPTGPMGPSKGNGPADPMGAGDDSSGSPQNDGKGGSGESPPIPGKDVDMVPAPSAEAVARQIEAVQKAVTSVIMGGGDPGSIPGEITDTLDKFVNPQLPWFQLLRRWFTDKVKTYRTYARPARRYLARGIYMPSRADEMSRLEHVTFFLDSSGSMTDDDLIITNSEAKFVWDVLKPKRMTIYNFDTEIHKIREFKEGDRFKDIDVLGRGGTDLRKVHKYLMKENPTLCVIMSDMFVEPMKEGPRCPILWVCTSNHPNPLVNVGKLIRMKP